MRPLRKRTPVLLLAIAMMIGILSIAAASPASAATCYGASCNNLDPEGRCSGDAKTVGAMDVGDGMLELRWSPSCVANWGRFTAYTRTAAGYWESGIGIWTRVTVWNPGAPSFGTARHGDLGITESTWSFMTDGTKVACTDVEIVHSRKNGDYESQGWTWGPCY